MNNVASYLEISGLTIDTIIGCYDYEKEAKQTIEIDIVIEFSSCPKICQTDNIDDGVCYDSMIKNIENYCENNKHNTIENLSYSIAQLIKNNINIEKENISSISVKIKKNPLKIENLKNGAIFCYKEALHL